MLLSSNFVVDLGNVLQLEKCNCDVRCSFDSKVCLQLITGQVFVEILQDLIYVIHKLQSCLMECLIYETQCNDKILEFY